jgi:hypothetical protein
MEIRKIIATAILLLTTSFLYAQQTIDISGKWSVQLNSKIDKTGNWLPVNLPGSLAEAGYGEKTTGSDFGVLTPTYKYIGIAWYRRQIEIPENWQNKTLSVFLERVLWESKLFVDGQEIDTQDGLGMAHVHKIGTLEPGVHTLTVRVNNDTIYNIGDKGHAYSDYTQSIWNGIVGRMEITAKDPTHIKQIRTFPHVNFDQLDVELTTNSVKPGPAKVTILITEIKTGEKVLQYTSEMQLTVGRDKKLFTIIGNGRLKKWTEFNPETYLLKASIKTKDYSDSSETEFGFLEIGQNGTQITINGQPVFLRGNLDCIHFPETGYPSCKIEDWERIFKIYKSYGLNHVRFHSWCPPEAAFKAANRAGIYIQAEASIWIDWWMSVDNAQRGRPEMNTKGFPKGLGFEPHRDSFVVAEMNRMVDVYGNNPSFTLFCIGNELGSSDFDQMGKWIANLKQKDPRRLYSASTARKILPVDDYVATHSISGVGRTRGLNGAQTNWDFETTYSQMNIPIIAHEIGQWPVYPIWAEIDKYNGVLKARNFEEFKAVAEKNGIADQDIDFKNASGALSQIMYKYETESFLRTSSCAGVQLLSMQDYQGQGEALIGWLDAHWDSKKITTPEKFREHFDETVPLMRTEKFIWKTDEIFRAGLQLSHYGATTIKNGDIDVSIETKAGEKLLAYSMKIKDIQVGTLTNLGKVELNLSGIKKAEQLILKVALRNTRFKNEWNLWVVPATLPKIETDSVLIATTLDNPTMEALNTGRKVLLIANNLGTEKTSTPIDFYPLYWSLTFFPGQGKTSIGTLFKNEHPAFDYFPTDSHSDWQWEPFKKSTHGFILNTLPADYKPIAQVVDDFHRNNKIGTIFEFKVGKGKLLVCGYNINNTANPMANQLKYSLLNYAGSNKFNPTLEVSETYLKTLFKTIPKAETATISTEFKDAAIQVDAGFNLAQKNEAVAWNKKLDKAALKDGFGYSVAGAEVWKDDHTSAWASNKMTIELSCPDGIMGTLFVQFNDWNKQGREGLLEIEGRQVKLFTHEGEKGSWIKLHTMREDTQDGKIVFKSRATKGGNLMISKIIFEKE